MDYELPDGSSVQINTPRFQAPEALFKPDLIKVGDETPGLHTMTMESIRECDIDVRKDLYANIIMSGGTTLYENLPERLEMEIDNMCPQPNLAKVIAPQDRYFSVWVGGSTLSSLSTFEAQWITKEDFDECGVEIVHRKCV